MQAIIFPSKTDNQTGRRHRLRGTIVAASIAALAATGMAATTGAAGAAASHTTDAITFTSHAHLTAQSDGTSKAVLVSDSCTLKFDGGAPTPCTLVAAGTIGSNGGTATAVVTSKYGAIFLDEVFAPTGPTTSIGHGSVKEIYPRVGVLDGTFTAAFEVAPTADQNVLLDWGTITVTH